MEHLQHLLAERSTTKSSSTSSDSFLGLRLQSDPFLGSTFTEHDQRAFVQFVCGFGEPKRFHQHSRDYILIIKSQSKFEQSRRPIIFVAHSLGGIVCANALLLAGNSPEEPVREIGKRTRGIAFLGTPFEGSDKAKWAETGLRFFLLFKDTNDAIPTDLREDSKKLSDVGEAFPDLLRRRRESEEPRSKIEVTCFCEERRTKILGLAGLETVVSRESASLSGYETLSIPANHLKMCRFEESEEIGYQRVAGVLLRWTKNLVAESVEKP